MPPSILILYHFFYPDDVAGATHLYQFAQELGDRGWDVTVLTTNRYCREPHRIIPRKEETVAGIRIIRLSRPSWDQARPLFRLLNSTWLILGWICKILHMRTFDVILVGSDPAFAPVIIPVARFFKKAKVFTHWCFDLYPEIIVADGDIPINAKIVHLLQTLMQKSYKALHLIADLGDCMRRRLAAYNHGAQQVTLVPWALVEPKELKTPNPAIRKKLFGDAALGLLYSGTLGRAHDYDMFLKLARRLRQKSLDVHFCFACRGNKVDELKTYICSEDTNISFTEFVEEHSLEEHLNAADIHIISLKEGWDGLVVPSKFFGSIAMGKPVIYAGPSNSAIAAWIQKFDIGFCITNESIEDIIRILDILEHNKSGMNILQKRAFSVYKQFFSKEKIVNEWDCQLRKLIAVQNCNNNVKNILR